MNTLIKSLGAIAISIIVGFSSMTTATAAPPMVSQSQLSSSTDLVQYREERRPRWKHRYERRYDRVERRHDRRGYWNGHRGYREHRRGYRRHSDGFYYRNDVFRLYID